MAFVIGILYLVGLPALIAWVLAASLSSLVPEWPARLRIVLAAMSAGLLPIAVPVAAVLDGDTLNNGESRAEPLVALVMVGLVMTVLIGLPIASRVTRKRARSGDVETTFD